MLENSKWIITNSSYGTVCPKFKKDFEIKKTVKNAVLKITALGCYEVYINDKRVGDFILAPGWTSYDHRLQVQEYKVEDMLGDTNTIEITVGEGWHLGGMCWRRDKIYSAKQPSVILEMTISYSDGTEQVIVSDESFVCTRTNILFSGIYDGEVYSAEEINPVWEPVKISDYTKSTLIPQEGEEIKEVERIKPVSVIKSASQKNILDFGQNLTGYVEFKCTAPKGTIIELKHSEILDENRDVYTENLRTAKQRILFIADGTERVYKPHFTFQGFRYVSVENWQGELNPDDFTAIAVHSDMKRTGKFKCSNEKINKLYENIIWGQRGNYLDVPTDCPQRDERLGWLGDAQVFVKAAAYNYDVHKFFIKWLNDLRYDQFEDGGTPAVVPNVLGNEGINSSAWGDAAVICPWTIYLFYNDKELLKRQYESMCKWISYIRSQGDNEYLWNTGFHYGDWLALDAEDGDRMGATQKDLIATAYFAYSTSLVIKAGKVLEYDIREYEALYENIVKAYKKEFIKDGKLANETQTAYALSIMFDLTDDLQGFGEKLNELVAANGNRLNTGFVGTPHLLHALTKTGHAETAYSLLLQEAFPSWLYSVNQGATTIWEHWDGINEEGKLWDKWMNSFNHYAYGAVADWMYEAVAGIRIDEEKPGFENVILAPVVCDKLEWAEASVDTNFGTVRSKWYRENGKITYEFDVPNTATLKLENEETILSKGNYKFSLA